MYKLYYFINIFNISCYFLKKNPNFPVDEITMNQSTCISHHRGGIDKCKVSHSNKEATFVCAIAETKKEDKNSSSL